MRQAVDGAPPAPSDQDRLWSALGLYGGSLCAMCVGGPLVFIVPLLIWQLRGRGSVFVSFHAQQLIWFLLACMLAWVAIGAIGLVVVISANSFLVTLLVLGAGGILLLFPVACVLMGAVRSYRGDYWQLPFMGNVIRRP